MGAAKDLLGVVTGQVDRVFDAEQSEIYRANFKLFRGVVYSAVMEKRTCVVCAGYDGTIYWMEKVPKGEKGETFEKKPALPIHPNCRCAYVPFCKSWEELPVDPEEFSKSARKLLGGDIPKTRKWEEWFLSRTEGVQKKILGETRFNLWKARAVEIKDLSVGSKVVPLVDLIEAPKVAKKLKEIKKTVGQESSKLKMLLGETALSRRAGKVVGHTKAWSALTQREQANFLTAVVNAKGFDSLPKWVKKVILAGEHE